MAGRDSSSKRKSSKRKRDTTSSKRKSRRKESKKRSRIHDSLSSYSDDESSNSEYTSSSKSDHRRRINKNKRIRRNYSSSSDDQSLSADYDSLSSDYKHKKTRNSRDLLKSTKNRARQRSTRPKGDGDSHSGRKRKRPKKKLSKKKPKKHLSSRFSSSDSDCSTCRGSSSSSSSIEESKRQRSKVSFKARKKHRVRSPSCSSHDRGGERSVGVGRSDGAFSPVINNFNNSRRLRSVIAVVDQRCDEGENRWEKDPNKEEIVYDRNDYPSPKSMDSNEGGTKTEIEDVAGEEVTEMEKSRISEGDRDNDNNCHSKAVDMNNFEKGKEIDTSAPVSALGDDVLESILRQKALENLKKFKGRLPTSTNVKVNNESSTNRPSDAIIKTVTARETNENSGLKQDLSQPTEVKKLTDSEDVEKEETIMDTRSVDHRTDGAALLKCSIEDKYASFDAVSTKPISSSEICAGAETMNASMPEPSSSIGLMSGEHSLEIENESKDGSEFETKTMSVMRGGEMVQVSYKVYIPKKATALARRQLRR